MFSETSDLKRQPWSFRSEGKRAVRTIIIGDWINGFSLLQGKRESLRFARRLSPLLAAGDLDTVSAKSDESAGPLGRVIGVGLSAYRVAGGDDPDLAFESVARALER